LRQGEENNNWLSGTIAIVDAEAIKPEHPPTRAVTDGVGIFRK
jgi:hypothetical protein